ncbi:MAG: cadherin-like domain-containing protein, partial [Planctomycetales bacterium]|nr:cadherin-like domain-containing protein [Planctomycetales bacterium]
MRSPSLVRKLGFTERLEERALLTAVVGATLDDQVGGTLQAGDGITYLATISNSGNTNATTVSLSNPLDPNSSFVPGSTKIGVAAFSDFYNVIGNIPRTLNSAGGLLANDVDIDAGGAFTVTGAIDIGGTAATSGSLVVNADGSFVYTPAAATTGTDIFRYTVMDSDGLVSTGQVTFAISSMVWFVDNSAPGGGDGSFNSPFNSLAPLNGAGGVGDVDAPGDSIFIYETGVNYTGGFQLENNQILFGDGYAVQYFDLVVGNSNVAPILTSSSGNNLTLASNNVVRGLNLTSTGGTALAGTNFGSASITNMLVNATNATAINLNTGTGTFSFSSVNANGGTNGIVLNNVNATSFAITGNNSTATQGGNDTGGVIQNMTGDGVVITNSNNITLQNMTIGNPATTVADSPNGNVSITDDGIDANTVTNLTLKNVTIAETGTQGVRAASVTNFVMDDSLMLNPGNDNEENGILFTEVRGDNFIRRSVFDAFHESGVEVVNALGTVDLTIDDTTFQDTKGSAFGAQAILLQAHGTASIVAKITGTAGAGTKSVFDDIKLNAIHAISDGTTSDIQLTVENTRILETGAGDAMIIMNADNAGSGNITVNNTYFTDDTPNVFPFAPAAIIVKNDSSGLLDATITNNNADGVQLLLLNHDDLGSGGAANGTTRALISNNTVDVRSEGSIGIDVIASETGPTGTSPDLSLTITNNTVTLPDNVFFFVSGLRINATNNARVNAQITGNTFESDATGSGGSGIELQQLDSSIVNLASPFAGGDNNATNTFLTAQNPASESPHFITGIFGVGAPVPPATTTAPSPLVVAPPIQDPGDIGLVGPAGDGLSQSDLDAAVTEAITRWTAVGLSADQIATLQGVDIQTGALGSGLLGITLGNQVRIDDNGAEYGWYVDTTLGDDNEFIDGPANHQVDLLTVVMHEFGHVLGISHTATGLMGEALALGTRYNPTQYLVNTSGNFSSDIESLSVAVPALGGGTGTGSINLGTLPAFSTVQVRFQATVGTGFGLPSSLSAQGTVTADSIAAVLTDDPNVGGSSDPTVTSVESLTLGGTVWSETGSNSVYDLGSDTAENGITVRIYHDNGDGVLTLADGAFLASTTTSNMSGQDGRYEFTNLAPGNYIVEVLRSGAIATRDPISGAVDPDNNVDNDNNGSFVSGFDVASSALTLDYGTEPGGDVNNTLDFGFVDNTTLSVTIDLAAMNENGGSSSATVTRSGPTVGDLVVNLSSNDTGEAVVPFTVTILNGQASANFSVTAVDDNFIDGT